MRGFGSFRTPIALERTLTRPLSLSKGEATYIAQLSLAKTPADNRSTLSREPQQVRFFDSQKTRRLLYSPEVL